MPRLPPGTHQRETVVPLHKRLSTAPTVSEHNMARLTMLATSLVSIANGEKQASLRPHLTRIAVSFDDHDRMLSLCLSCAGQHDHVTTFKYDDLLFTSPELQEIDTVNVAAAADHLRGMAAGLLKESPTLAAELLEVVEKLSVEEALPIDDPAAADTVVESVPADVGPSVA